MNLTFDELLQPRSVQQLLAFVDKVEECLRETPEARALARSAGGAYKKHREEIRPFSHYLKHTYASADARVSFPPEDNAADVIVELDGIAYFYQITLASDPEYGEQEALRLKVLAQQGRAAAFGQVSKTTDDAGNRSLEIEGRAVVRERHAEEVAARTLEAISRKSARHQPDETGLAVVIHSPIRSAMPIIFDLVEAAAPRSSYAKLILIDDSGEMAPRTLRRSRPKQTER